MSKEAEGSREQDMGADQLKQYRERSWAIRLRLMSYSHPH